MRSLVSTVLLFLAVSPMVAENSSSKPLGCSELLTLFASGIPNQRILRIVDGSEIEFSPNEAGVAFSQAGADSSLVNLVRSLKSTQDTGSNADCPVSFIKMASLSRAQDFSSAEEVARKLLRSQPENVGLDMALGYFLREQNRLDEAFDVYSDAKDLDPANPEVHNGLANVFFGSNDAEATIGEARTSLSIDPQNQEAHRLLGLGLFLDEKYDAAMNAFEEALVRDPHDAGTYFGIGLTERALGELSAAAQAFHRSVQLDPNFGDAQRELELVLIELDRKGNTIRDTASNMGTPTEGSSSPSR